MFKKFYPEGHDFVRKFQAATVGLKAFVQMVLGRCISSAPCICKGLVVSKRCEKALDFFTLMRLETNDAMSVVK